MLILEKLEKLKEFQKEIVLLNQISGLLIWDQQVNLPSMSTEIRAEQISIIDGIIHGKITSEEFYNLAKELGENKENLNEIDRVMVERVLYDLEKERKLPIDFVKELSKKESIGFSKWQEAKNKKDFSIFAPILEEIVKMKRKQAEYLGYETHPYNALLNLYEEGMTIEKIKPHFDILKEGLIKLLKEIESSEAYSSKNNSFFEAPKNLQISLIKDIINKIGLKESFSRLDFSEHPFSIKLGEKDIRITTKLKENPIFGFESSIHEAGHALYELGMPEEHKFTFLGQSPSHGLHESQSRFWENMVGKSYPFLEHFIVNLKKAGISINLDEFFKVINNVFPGKIRIESDEVHYCLHIILRFEIELGLIEGTIKVDELPKVWNNKIEEYFGVTPEDDAEGVLQDLHWSGGDFGYFPTYAIGTIYAAQLFNSLKKNFPEIENDIQKGDFTKIRDWLKEKVHKHGKIFLADDLIRKVTGEGLNVKVYLDYLNKKYSEIYNFQK